MQHNTQYSYHHFIINNSNATIASDPYYRHMNHIQKKKKKSIHSIVIFHTKDSSNLLDHQLVSMLKAQTRITPAALCHS